MIFKRARSGFADTSADILVPIPEAKNSKQSARQRRGLSAPRHHRPRYRCGDDHQGRIMAIF